MKPSCIFRFLIPLFMGIIVLATGCKKEPQPDIPEPEPVEEIIPGVTVGYGAELLPAAEYQKLPLIEEPIIRTSAGGRLAKDPVLPPSYDLSAKMPPPASQGALGSCTSWAVAYAARSYLSSGLNNLSYLNNDGKRNDNMVFSPSYVHNQANEGDGRGCSIYKALDLIKNQGVCTWQDMPYSAVDYKTQPTVQQKQKAASHKIQDWGRVTINQSTFRKFLYYDYPIIIAAGLDENFNGLKHKDANGEYIWKEPGTPRGLHAMVIVGYDDNKKAFKIQNSWGPTWANKGFIWLSYDMVNQVILEAYLMVDPGNSKMKTPTVVTLKPDKAEGDNVILNGSILDLGESAILHFGFAISTVKGLPTELMRVNLNVDKVPINFSLTPYVTGTRLWYRSYVQTITGIIYGDTMSVDISKVSTGTSKDMLLAEGMEGVTAVDMENGNILWQQKSINPVQEYSPSGLITNGLYISGSSNTGGANTYMTAMNLSDGKIAWKGNYGSVSLSEARPVVINDLIFGMTSKEVFAVKASTGNLVWSNTFGTFGALGGKGTNPRNNLSLTKDNKLVMMLPDGDYKQRLYLLNNPSTGTGASRISDNYISDYFKPRFGDNFFIAAEPDYSRPTAFKISPYAELWVSPEKTRPNASVLQGEQIILMNEFNSSKPILTSLEKKSGKVLWEYVPNEGNIYTFGSVNPSFDVSEDHAALIVRDAAGKSFLHIININTGKLVWNKEVAEGSLRGTWEVLIVKDKVIVDYKGIGDSAKKGLVAFNLTNGNKLWQTPTNFLSIYIRAAITKDGKTYYNPASAMKQSN